MSSVKDIGRKEKLVVANPHETVLDVVKKMYRHNVGSVLILDSSGKLAGIFTERDLVKLVAEGKPLTLPVESVMSRNPIVAREDDPIPLVGSKMIEHWVRHIPIVDSEGRPIGIVSIRDVLRRLLSTSSFP